MIPGPPRVVPLGDRALLVVLGNGVDARLSARVHRVAAALEELHRRDPRFGGPVPAYATVLVPVDPLDPGVDAAAGEVAAVVAQSERDDDIEPGDDEPPLEIPTRYGGPDGPDLEEVAALHGLRPADVADLHASVDYLVHFLGFAPGFAYLGTVPDRIVTPRLPTPRPRVAAGSVALAGEQTGIYPTESPGGWRLIGRTEVRVWDATRDPPALLLPGRRVRFVPLNKP